MTKVGGRSPTSSRRARPLALGIVDVGGGINMGSGGGGGNRAIATVGMARLVEKIQSIAEKNRRRTDRGHEKQVGLDSWYLRV